MLFKTGNQLIYILYTALDYRLFTAYFRIVSIIFYLLIMKNFIIKTATIDSNLPHFGFARGTYSAAVFN